MESISRDQAGEVVAHLIGRALDELREMAKYPWIGSSKSICWGKALGFHSSAARLYTIAGGDTFGDSWPTFQHLEAHAAEMADDNRGSK